MTIKIDISKLQTKQLDATNLNWILKFSQALEKHNGTVLELRSDNLLEQLVNQAKQKHTAELQDLYHALKASLRAQVKRERASFEQVIADSQKTISSRAPTLV